MNNRRNRVRNLLETLENRLLMAIIPVTNNLDSGEGSLRDAISVAQDGDTIDLASVTGPITLTSEISVAKTVSLQGPGADVLSIDGGNATRLFNLSGGGSFYLKGVSLTHGYAGAGGAILATATTTLEEVRFIDNHSGGKGGAISSNQELTLINCTFDSNSGISTVDTAMGGAIWSHGGVVDMTGCTFVGNSAVGTADFDGSALGGAIAAWNGTLVNITNSTFTLNEAVSANIFDSSSVGGAIVIYGDVPSTIRNSTISNNHAVSQSDSWSEAGGLIFLMPSGNTLVNSIVAANTAMWNTDISNAGAVSSGGHNLIGVDPGQSFVNGVNGDQVGMSNTPLDPKLNVLGDYGGKTFTMALLSDSTAIDAGDSLSAPETDQRGYFRSAAADIGAFEFNGIAPNATPSNQSPTFSSTAVTSATAESVYTYNITTGDAEGDTRTITAENKPAWLTLTDNGDGTATLTGTPTNNDTADNNVVLKVSDANGSATQSWSILISTVNHLPAYTSTDVTSATSESEYSYTMTASDADNDTLSFVPKNIPSWLTLTDHGNGTATLKGTPTNSYAGDNIVSVTVFDGTDYVAHKFTLNVAPINHAPTFSSNGITSATSEQVYTYNITTTDSDGDAVHLNAQKIPSWLSFTDNGDGTATLTGTPTNANVGSHLIEIKISDYQPLNSWDVQSFIIDVSAINHAPTFSSTASTSATADQGYTYNITATDLDGDPINFDKLQLPTWLKLVDYMEGTAILSGTPHNVDAGANQIKLSVTDGEGSRVQVFTIDVAAVNHKPVFSSQATTDVLSESKYSYTIKTSDEDGDALTISAQTLPAWLTFTDNGDGTATLKGTPTNASKGANAVVLKVSDGDLSDTQSFSVDVQAINHLPIFTSTAVTAATSESVYTYNIKTTDTDGDAVTITAATLPAWLTLTDHGNGTATLTGTPTNANKGANAITIFVTDKGQNVPQQFTIDVTPVNHAPSFPVTAASEALGGKFWTQTITVMEQDGDTLAIQALNLPGWMSFVDNHNGTATLKGTPTDADYGTDTYVLQVSDGKASAQQTFAVNVGLQDSYIDASGILHVNGTESADVLIVGLKDTYVRVSRNGVIKNYLRSKVSGVEVRGLGGADTITLSVPGMSGYAIGGEGNDTLSGGEEDDILTGGAGADRILGMGGNDRLNGMGGNDRIYGGDGGDRMYGGDGNDTIDGGSGVDRFYGEEGNDIFVANDKKKDILYGGAGTNSAIVDTLLDDSNDIDSFLAPGSVAKKHRRA